MLIIDSDGFEEDLKSLIQHRSIIQATVSGFVPGPETGSPLRRRIQYCTQRIAARAHEAPARAQIAVRPCTYLGASDVRKICEPEIPAQFAAMTTRAIATLRSWGVRQ